MRLNEKADIFRQSLWEPSEAFEKRERVDGLRSCKFTIVKT